jgi:hypothetical protein
MDRYGTNIVTTVAVEIERGGDFRPRQTSDEIVRSGRSVRSVDPTQASHTLGPPKSETLASVSNIGHRRPALARSLTEPQFDQIIEFGAGGQLQLQKRSAVNNDRTLRRR